MVEKDGRFCPAEKGSTMIKHGLVEERGKKTCKVFVFSGFFSSLGLNV